MKNFLVVFLFFISCAVHSQDSLSLPYIDIGSISLADTFSKRMMTAYVSDDSSASMYRQFIFRQGKQHNPIPPSVVPKKIICKFRLINNSDSVKTVYFFPGFYFDDVSLYQNHSAAAENADVVLLKYPEKPPKYKNALAFRKIELGPGENVEFLAEIRQVKTYNNNFVPRLVNEDYLESFIKDQHHAQEKLDQTTYIFTGLLLMMILFSLANYVQGGNRDFLYYSGYAFFLAALFFTKTYFNRYSSEINYFFESYLDFILQTLGIGFYIVFMQRFLETKKKYPFIFKLYNFGIIMLAASLVLYSYLHFFTDNYRMQYLVETSTKILLLLMIVAFIIYSNKHWKDKLLRFVVWGNFFLLIFSLISQLFIFTNPKFPVPMILNTALFYYEFGLFLELVCFLLGLSYKNRKQIIEQTREREQLKMENERKEFEKQMAVVTAQQEERNRISTDMHDELGSGMTAIRLMSEIAKKKMKENTPMEIERISQSADDVLNKMNAIIWSMNSKNDSLGNLVSYIRAYAHEYLEGTEMICKVNIPEHIPENELSGDKRRNLFLCVKESLNNVLKHSKAKEVVIDILTDKNLTIYIHDNGVGIDMNNLRQFGNGLQNIERRMKSIGGSYNIINKYGTLTTIVLPL